MIDTLVFFGLLIFFIWRGSRVVDWRQDVERRIWLAIDADLDNGVIRNLNDADWRWLIFRSVSVDRMTFMFWIDLNDFYADTRFMNATPVLNKTLTPKPRKRKVD